MWDYCSAQFKAPTDFRVGEAIRYFREKKYQVKLLYKASENPSKDEYELVRELQVSGLRLINGLAGYKYNTTLLDKERGYIRRFCDLIIAKCST